MSTEVLGWSVKTKLCSACRYFFSPSILNIIESHPMQGLGVGFGEVRTKAHIKKAGEGMWIPAFKVCENIPRDVVLLCMFLERNASLEFKLENLSVAFWVLQHGKKSFIGLGWCVSVWDILIWLKQMMFDHQVPTWLVIGKVRWLLLQVVLQWARYF